MDKAKDQQIWSDRYHIHSFDVGPDMEAPLPVLCKFLQESAYRNADHLGFGFDQLKENQQFWVLSRLLVKMDKYPRWNEHIDVLTWPAGVERLFAFRDFEIYDREERYLGAATSAWLILDSEKHRPQRPVHLAGRNDLVHERSALGVRPDKIPPFSNPVPGPSFPVRHSDLDLYEHVNNARYIQWIVDHYPPSMHKTYEIESFEINFLAEAKFPDQVFILTENVTENPPTFLHGVRRESDNRDICMVRIQWKLRS